MSLATQPNASSGAPELIDLPVPVAVGSPAPALPGSPVPPAHRIYFYSPDEWEVFITEWATGVAISYRQIKQLGGSGDRGVDVAAFKTDRGLEDAWDCFQAKHYDGSLTLSDAFPEMLKIFHGVVDAFYSLPDRYVFVAPRGCGPTLNRLLSKPTELRRKFLELLDAGGTATRLYDEQALRSIRELAETSDFSVFQSLELNEMLDIHRKTPYYADRFGTSLPERPPVGPTPEAPAPNEATYVKKLVDVYHEQDPASCSDTDSVAAHATYGAHLQRQREAFYSAEALRLYARDSVPDGTFELLQDDVYTGVVDTAEVHHSSGLDRLRAVLTQSGQLDLGAHRLISVSKLQDRQGICHQLANADQLTWVTDDA
ncbi:ABC-three component system protein [Microbacterium paulum]